MAAQYISEEMAGAIGVIAALILLSIFLSDYLAGSEHAQFTDPVFLFAVLITIVNGLYFATILFRD